MARIILLSLLPNQENKDPADDTQDDNLEIQPRGKRAEPTTSPGDPDEIETYQPSLKTNHYESKGTYVVELVGEKRRLLRLRRSVDEDNYVETSLLAFINQSKQAAQCHIA